MIALNKTPFLCHSCDQPGAYEIQVRFSYTVLCWKHLGELRQMLNNLFYDVELMKGLEDE